MLHAIPPRYPVHDRLKARDKKGASAAHGNDDSLCCEEKLWVAASSMRRALGLATYRNVVLGVIALIYIADVVE